MGRIARGALILGSLPALFAALTAGVSNADEWKEITAGGAKPPARYYHTAVDMGGAVYVYGGITSDPAPDTRQMAGPVNDFWKFDGRTWIKIADNAPPAVRYLHSAVVHNNKMYVFGGQTNSSTYLNDMWSYSSDTNSWKEEAQGPLKPSARSDHSAAVTADGKMIVYGGKGPAGYADNNVWVFDFAAGTWTQKSPGPKNITCHTAVMADGKMYVFGGKNQSGYSNDVGTYDPATDTWEDVPVQGMDPAPRAHYSVVSEDGGSFTVFGGESSAKAAYDDVWQFDTTTKTWAARGKMPKGVTRGISASTRSRVAAVTNHGRFFTVFGGESAASADTQSVHLLFGGMTVVGSTLAPTDALWLHYTDMANSFCTATLSESLQLHQPYFTFDASALWYDLQYAADPQFPSSDIMFKLSNLGTVATPVAYAGCEASLVSEGPIYILRIPSLTLSSVSYWVDLQLIPTTDGVAWFKLVNYGVK